MIQLKPEQIEAIRRHGELDYPDECCGLLIGTFGEGGRKVVREIMPISNAREASARRNRFLIAPEDMLRGERHARALQQDVVGFYHSHPDHTATPSQFDLEYAWPVYSYVIASMAEGRGGELKSWELCADRSRFDAEEISNHS